MSSSTWSTSGPTIASTSSFRGPGCASHSSAPPEIALALHNSCRKSSQNPKGTGAPLTFILKHMHNLSDEALCERCVENPYFQYFCGEVAFRHELPFDRSSLTRWRQRLGEEQIVALLQESLSVAHRTGAIDTKDLERVAIDTTVHRWVENPYFQYFCGEVVFRHELPFDRSSLTRWRQRLGEEQIVALLQESL